MSASFSHDPGTDHEVTLRDGRRVTYSVFGDPDGVPVLSCHGGLLCRFDVEPCAPYFVALGVRVVSPDRPGVGGSDRKPGHSTGEWADDAREFLDVGHRAHGEWLGLAMGEGGRNGAGMVDGYRAFVGPWGFALGDIAVPTHIYQGTADQSVAPSWAKELSAAIAGAELTEYEGGGHMIAFHTAPTP